MTLKEKALKEVEAIEVLNGGKNSYTRKYIQHLEETVDSLITKNNSIQEDKDVVEVFINMNETTCNLCKSFVPAATGSWYGYTPVCKEIEVCPSNKGTTTTLLNCSNARYCEYFKPNRNPSLEKVLVEGTRLVYATMGKVANVTVIK